MPFDALKGFKEALREKEKVIIPKKELTNYDVEKLNYKFSQIKKGKIVKVIYYNGEDYLEVEGIISKIDFDLKFLMIVKTKINFDDIYDIHGKDIFEYEN